MKYCPNCGTDLPGENSKFCLQCGTELPATGAPAVETPAAPTAAEPSVVPQQTAPKPPVSEPPVAPKQAAPKPPVSETPVVPKQAAPQPPPADIFFAAKVPSEPPHSAVPTGEPLFTPTFAAESGELPGFSVPPEGLPTGKEAEELLARALADTGPSIFAGGAFSATPLFEEPAATPPQADISAAEPPVPEAPAVEAPGQTMQPVDLFSGEAGGLFDEVAQPAASFAGTEVPVGEPAASAPEATAPEADALDESPLDTLEQDSVLAEEAFTRGMQPEETETADAALAAGDTAEFSLAGQEETPQQVFPVSRQQDVSSQTIPFESQRENGNLFEEERPPVQRYPQQRQDAPRQRYEEPGQRARQQEGRASMVANIAQVAGADEEETLQRPRPMAEGRDVPRPSAPQYEGRPTRRAPSSHPRPVMEEDWPPPRKKKGSGKIVRNILLIVLLFLVATFIATIGLLYFRNRPAAAIETFTDAITARDYAALNSMVVSEVAPSDEGWAAFCDAFTQEEQLNALKTQLAGKPSYEDREKLSSLTYQAVTLEGESLFLFINKYHVRIAGVELLAPGAAEGTALDIPGGESGTATADGVVFGKFMPGKYVITVTPPGTTIEIEAFDVLTPNRIEQDAGGTVQNANVTVENCASDDAVLYINGSEVSEKPSGGTVQLAAVPVGAEIKIIANTDGARTQASVIFSDPAVTTLRFENYAPVEGVEDDDATQIAKDATPEQINQALATFYTSYLDAINAQDIGRVQLSTEKNNANLTQRISSPANAANTYTYVSAACNANSIVAGEEGGVPSIKLNGTFTFSFAPREEPDNVQQGSNHQSVHLLYVGGEWVVNGFVFVEDADYNNNVIANF